MVGYVWQILGRGAFLPPIREQRRIDTNIKQFSKQNQTKGLIRKISLRPNKTRTKFDQTKTLFTKTLFLQSIFGIKIA